MATRELTFETEIGLPSGFDSFQSPSGKTTRSNTVGGANGTSWAAQIDKTTASEFPGGDVAPGFVWDGDTSLRVEWWVHMNGVDTVGGAFYRIRNFRTNNDQLTVPITFQSSTNHTIKVSNAGCASTADHSILSNAWQRIGFCMRKQVGYGTDVFDVELLIGGVVVETETAQTYTGSYSFTTWEFGAPSDIGTTDHALDGFFYIDEIRMNNTGDDPFAVAPVDDPQVRALLGVGRG